MLAVLVYFTVFAVEQWNGIALGRWKRYGFL